MDLTLHTTPRGLLQARRVSRWKSWLHSLQQPTGQTGCGADSRGKILPPKALLLRVCFYVPLSNQTATEEECLWGRGQAGEGWNSWGSKRPNSKKRRENLHPRLHLLLDFTPRQKSRTSSWVQGDTEEIQNCSSRNSISLGGLPRHLDGCNRHHSTDSAQAHRLKDVN